MTISSDDDQVEYAPGRTVRRDVGLRMGLVAPEVRLGGARRAALAPTADPRPDPAAPPLQPSHEDLAPQADGRAGTADDEIGDARRIHAVTPEAVERRISESGFRARAEDAGVTGVGDPTPPRAPRPRPAKRSIADILAASERGFHALRGRGRA